MRHLVDAGGSSYSSAPQLDNELRKLYFFISVLAISSQDSKIS